MIKRYFCTHFDINYTPHGRSLAQSLFIIRPNSELITFCMDDESYRNLTENTPANVRPIHFSKLEAAFPGLQSAKNNRSIIEYFYTCSPAICNYVLSNLEGINEVTYLDADLYFFSNPDPIFAELGNYSVGIIEHKFSFFTKRNKVYGKFNVGWITFRNDINGMACLNSWTNNCIEWCYQRLEGEKYADQKYLDYWQRDFVGIYVIKNIGANLAIWNISNYRISLKNNRVYVNENELIFYHFANFKQIGFNIFKTDLSRVFVRCTGVIKNNIYLPYIQTISKNLDNTKLIVAKKDAHVTGLNMLLIKITRVIRQVLFPDIIKIVSFKL
jgi:hypothetical protein